MGCLYQLHVLVFNRFKSINMKTPEKILDEIAAENMINIQQMVTTKQLVVLAMRRYAKLYHKSEVKKLNRKLN
jgi:hypothetical protein